MREQTVVSYGYLAGHRDMLPRNRFTQTEPAMNYSTFEENFLKQTKGNTKRCVRRRVEKARNHQYSDVESDTGSDGLAVNSGGSGRSGDWGPPKRRSKPRAGKQRCHSKPSLTDSGISLSKADSGSFSELSYQQLEDDVILQYPGEINHNERRTEEKLSRSIEKQSSIASYQRSLLRRTNSCSALPSNIKPIVRNKPVNNSKVNCDAVERQISDIEIKEDSILRQCFKNEGLTEYSDTKGRSYVFDCSHPLEQSRFPLPDHLNYPLCKYRYKSESVLSRTSIKPLKKIKDSWRKLKSRKLSQSRANETISTISSDTSYIDYLHEIDEESDDILSRLATDPKEKKSFLKKIVNRIGGSRTYKAQEKPTSSQGSDAPVRNSNFQRSASTRSIPEALKNMWNKVHDLDFDQATSPSINTLSRALSMPSISTIYPRNEPEEVMYFDEPGLVQNETSYFSNFFKPMETKYQKPKTKLSGGDDVITGVLGVHSTIENEFQSTDLSSVKENIEPEYRDEHIEKTTLKTVQKIEQPHQHDMYSSCYELSSPKSHFYNPQEYYSSYLETSACAHCSCCMHSQRPSTQFNIPPYPQPNYTYEVSHGPVLTPGQNLVSVNGQCGRRENVIAPLDVKMSCERKAERRKISDMIFDTFV